MQRIVHTFNKEVYMTQNKKHAVIDRQRYCMLENVQIGGG